MAGKKVKKEIPKQYGGSYYTYGNVAYDLDRKEVPIRKQEIREKHLRMQRAAERKESRMNTVRVLLAVFILFAGSIVFVSMHVIVANADIELRKQKDKLIELKAQTATLEAELAEQVDLDYIKKQATERLGMTEPQPYQIEYIDVPKESYTVQYDAEEEEKKKIGVGLSSVWDFFVKE